MLNHPATPFHLRPVRSAVAGAPAHTFCGPTDVPGAICPNCALPLQTFFTLDTSDARLELASGLLGSRLPLLWCWCCPVLEGPFRYRVRNGLVSLLWFKTGAPLPDTPYESYSRHFQAQPAVLVELSAGAQRLIQEIHDGHSIGPRRYRRVSVPSHQVGGVPYLLQGPEYQQFEADSLKCPDCDQPMPLLASVGDRCPDRRGFSGNPWVQVLFHFCPHHGTVTAIQQCD